MADQSLLGQCQRYFPGLAWHLGDGYEKASAHCFLGGERRLDFSLTWNPESYGLTTYELTIQVNRQTLLASFTGFTPASALAQAAADDGVSLLLRAVVGPVAGPGWMAKPVTKDDIAQVGQAFPPDRQAQAEAAARAMAYSLEKERHLEP